jgi:hypothetical protein
MKIELDEVTDEYVWRSLGSMRELVDVKPKELRRAGLDVTEFRERMFMSVLETAVEMGVVTHRFDMVNCVDLFDCDLSLILNWEKLFPGQKITAVNCGERVRCEMAGDRSRFFDHAWIAREEGQKAWEATIA